MTTCSNLFMSEPKTTEQEDQLIRNAPDPLLASGKAMIGKRRATHQECVEELQRRIVNRRKAAGL